MLGKYGKRVKGQQFSKLHWILAKQSLGIFIVIWNTLQAGVMRQVQMEPADAFLKVFGRPVRFLRKAETADLGNWGFTTRRDLVWVYRNAPHFNDDDRFAVWATGRNLLSMSWAMLLKM
jgi:hypothetical protein